MTSNKVLDCIKVVFMTHLHGVLFRGNDLKWSYLKELESCVYSLTSSRQTENTVIISKIPLPKYTKMASFIMLWHNICLKVFFFDVQIYLPRYENEY